MLPKPSITVRLRAALMGIALVFGLVVASPSPAEAAPKAPSGLTRASYSNNAVRLKWKAVKGAAAYQVKYASNSKLKKASYVTVTVPVAEIGGLKASKNYYFKVRALKADGKALTKYSKTKKIKTRSKKSYSALSPAGLNATNNFGDEVTINWGAQGTSSLYRLRWATKKSMKGAKSIYVTGTSRIVEGLKRGTPYYFTVTVLNSKKKTTSQTSSVFKVTTAAKISFGTPTAVQISRVNPTDFTISWAGVRKAPAYEINYTAGAWTEPEPVITTTAATAQLTGLVANTDYQVKIRVLDALAQPAGEFSTVAVTHTRSQDAELRVASYNVMCHTCGSKSKDPTAVAEPWTVRRDVVVQHISETAPHVIALQEARQSKLKSDGDTELTQFQDLLKRLGTSWALTNTNRYPCSNPNSDSCLDDPAAQVNNGASLGVRIAYRTDELKLLKANGVTRQGSIKLPTAPADGSGSLPANPRYMAWAFFQQKDTGKKFLMVAVHLESRNDAGTQIAIADADRDYSCGAEDNPICGKVREAQAQAVVGHVAALNTENLPVVIAGDFASSRAELGGNKPYDVFMASGMQNPLGGTATTITNPPAGNRINIAYNSVNQLERKARRYGSDPAQNNTRNGAYNDYILSSPMYVSEFEQVVHVDQTTGEFIGVIPSDHNLIRASLWLP